MSKEISKFPKTMYRSQWKEGSAHLDSMKGVEVRVGRTEYYALYELKEIIAITGRQEEKRLKP